VQIRYPLSGTNDARRQGCHCSHSIAELRAEASNDLERATRSLTAEVADLKATLAELRLALAADRTVPLELPPLRPHVN